MIEQVIQGPLSPPRCMDENTKYYVNPTGRFVVGGPMATPASPAVRSSWTPTAAASLAEKRRRIRGICQLPAMAQAIQAIHPQGLGRNKQMVADLVRRRQFFLLSVLYGLKNRK